MNNEKELSQVRRNLTIGGIEVSVLVQPRIVQFGEGEKVVHKPRIASHHPLEVVEWLVGRDRMRYQEAASYTRRDSEEEAVSAVIEGKGDIALVSILPEQQIGEGSQLLVLATLADTDTHTEGVIHLIGRRDTFSNSQT